ncbi:hypothetical protein CR51_05705 [Caballeronia megalochromosomata]|nr:hypothetical protein CR51_05705 [Caballeronia megalochromosomata]
MSAFQRQKIFDSTSPTYKIKKIQRSMPDINNVTITSNAFSIGLLLVLQLLNEFNEVSVSHLMKVDFLHIAIPHDVA